jgi:hypothetical protein
MTALDLRCLLLVFAVLAAVDAAGGDNIAPAAVSEGVVVLGDQECADGVVLDDGTMETAYGWIPSVVDGRYIQRFEVADFRSPKMEQVCICWTRTRADDEVQFKVQLYRERRGSPADFPFATLDAVASAVPEYPESAFYAIDVSGIDMVAPTEVFFIGVRWNPSEDDRFFICADQSAGTPEVDGWFVDDRSEDGWESVLETNDPMFADHRAMMIRARAAEAAGEPPRIRTVGTAGAAFLVALLACLGAALLHRRGH